MNFFWTFVIINISLIYKSECLSTMAIDLGSEFIKVAIVKPGVPMEIALDRESQRKTQTVVSIRDGERLFGNPALSAAVKFPTKAFQFIPTIVGKKLSHPVVKLFQERFPYYDLREDETTGQLIFKHEEAGEFTAEEILAMILENARDTAENFAGHEMKSAVITVPPFFSQAERRAVLRAADMIGLNVLQLMNDNTAVALNYGIFRRKYFNSTAQYYIFYDMGSTSCSATVVSYQVVKSKDAGFMEDTPQLTVVGVGYDSTLGATSFAFRLRDYLAKEFNAMKKTKRDVTKDKRALAKLYKEAQRVIKVLSANKDTFAQIENLIDDQDFKFQVTRSVVETLCADLFERVRVPLDQALEAAQIPLPYIKEIILMGGGSRFPKFQEILRKVSGMKDLGKSINTDEAAALGAVYQAAYKSPGFRVKKFLVKDATILPIQVDFERVKTNDKGEPVVSRIQRVLFSRMNSYPQKKVLTFNKQTKDFDFHIGYADLTSLPNAEFIGFSNLSYVELTGITEAHAKYIKSDVNKKEDATGDSNKPEIESKGVKAHFAVDESGIFSLVSAEALFLKSPALVAKEENEKSQSTFQKIGKTFSNFFGGGDSDKAQKEGAEKQPASEEKKSDDKTDEAKKNSDETKSETNKDGNKEEKPTDDKPKDTDQTDKKEDANSAPNATETAANTTKIEDSKPVPISEELKFTIKLLDMPEPSSEHAANSKKKIADLRAKDAEKQQLEKSKNELESFIFEFKDRLERKEYVDCSTEEQRETILKLLNAANDWYEEQGMDTKTEEYVQKLNELKAATKDLEHRVTERRLRPLAFKKLKDALNHSSIFLHVMQNYTGEAANEPGKIFTRTEMEALSKAVNQAKEWLKEKTKADETMKLSDAPTFLAGEVDTYISSMERELRYLMTKMEIWKQNPPPPPTNTTENGTASDEKVINETKPEDSESPKESEKSKSSADKGGEGDVKDEKSKTEQTVKSDDQTTAPPSSESKSQTHTSAPPSDDSTHDSTDL